MLHETINEYCTSFKLSGIESNQRVLRAKETMLKFASFPKIKTIDTFDYKSSSVDKTLINELLTMRFIDEHKNILLFGPSGIGKTHLALSLGYVATQSRVKTKFIATSDLILQLESAKYTNTLDNYLKRVIYATRLLIIDEFGYVKLNEMQSNLFFQIVNKKYGALLGYTLVHFWFALDINPKASQKFSKN